MNVLVDMNLSPDWVGIVEAAGYTCQHWATIGLAYAADDEIMAFAKANVTIVLTHDLDFGAKLALTNADGPSVLQIRSDELDPKFIAEPVLAALEKIRSHTESNLLVTVSPERTRVRRLPFLVVSKPTSD